MLRAGELAFMYMLRCWCYVDDYIDDVKGLGGVVLWDVNVHAHVIYVDEATLMGYDDDVWWCYVDDVKSWRVVLWDVNVHVHVCFDSLETAL